MTSVEGQIGFLTIIISILGLTIAFFLASIDNQLVEISKSLEDLNQKGGDE